MIRYAVIRKQLKELSTSEMVGLTVLNEIVYFFPDLEEELQEELCDKVVDRYMEEDSNWNPIYFVGCLYNARCMMEDKGEDITDWDYIWEKADEIYF